MKVLGYVLVILVMGLLGYAFYPNARHTLEQAGWVEHYQPPEAPAVMDEVGAGRRAGRGDASAGAPAGPGTRAATCTGGGGCSGSCPCGRSRAGRVGGFGTGSVAGAGVAQGGGDRA